MEISNDKINGKININKKKIQEFFKQNAIFIVLVVLILGIAVKDSSFISVDVFKNILIQSSTRIIIALGAAFVILTGGADLSAGRMVGFSAVISASMLQSADYSNKFFPNLGQLNIIIPIIVAVAIGAAVGALNGFIVSRFQVPAFITTLGTMVIIYGANSLYFDLPPNN